MDTSARLATLTGLSLVIALVVAPALGLVLTAATVGTLLCLEIASRRRSPSDSKPRLAPGIDQGRVKRILHDLDFLEKQQTSEPTRPVRAQIVSCFHTETMDADLSLVLDHLPKGSLKVLESASAGLIVTDVGLSSASPGEIMAHPELWISRQFRPNVDLLVVPPGVLSTRELCERLSARYSVIMRVVREFPLMENRDDHFGKATTRLL